MSYTGEPIAANDPGLTKIIKAIAERLDIPAWNVFLDRDDSEPLQPEERPAIIVRAVDQVLDERMGESSRQMQWHAATIDIDFYVDADILDNITFQHNAMIAAAIALLHEDWTLGSLAQEMVPRSVTASADAVPTAGVAILTLDVLYQTEFGDWTKIVF